MSLLCGGALCYGAAMPKFAQITDLHLRPPGVLTLGTVDADQFVTDAVSALVTRHGDVDAVLVTGDVADLGEEDAYSRAAMLLSRFSAPVFVMPGNHDRTAALRDAFSAFPGVADAPVPHKVCYARSVGGVSVIALDTSMDGIESLSHGGELGTEQLEWLDATLAQTDEPALIAMHHPPFATGIGFMDEIGLGDAAAFSAVLAKHNHVRRVVCGHVHRVIMDTVGGVPALAIPGVAHQVELGLVPGAPANMVMEPPAYGIHIFGEGRAISHVGYVDAFGAPAAFSDMAAVAEPAQ